MKENILDLIIIETNKDHFKIWDDYFSESYKMQIYNSLECILENKKIFNDNTIFIIKMDLKKNNFSTILKNKAIYIIDKNFVVTDSKSDKN